MSARGNNSAGGYEANERVNNAGGAYEGSGRSNNAAGGSYDANERGKTLHSF